ncbi:MAG TPA: universal stress protein [Acidimicrobiales bacterium]|nr:universal stress protein [Acidimicrobiales bacterium]
MATIVVGIDGSEGAKAALAWACRAAHHEPGSKIVAVSTWLSSVPAPSPWFAGYDLPMDLTEITRAELQAAVAAVEAERGTTEIEQRVVCGSAASVLIAEGVAADMLVVGSRGVGGFKGLLLGSVSNQVVAHAQCPTVVVPRVSEEDRTASSATNSIVVGVDGSANSISALQWAARFARGSGATVRAVYVWRYPPVALAATPLGTGVPRPELISDAAVEELQGFLAESALPSDVRFEAVVREGPPAQVLLEEGRHTDLLVVGARGHEGFVGLLLGSVATAVAHHTPCPLAVIPDV